jgi:hypothetical protein
VDNETPLRIAYEVSVRAVEDQAHFVDDLRARSGTLVAASALVASFLGSRALAAADGIVILSFNGFAVGAFVLLAVLALVILWPFRFRLSPSAAEMIDVIDSRAATDPVTLEEAYRELALQLEGWSDLNAPKIRLLSWLLRVAILAFVCEVTAWIVVLWRA